MRQNQFMENSLLTIDQLFKLLRRLNEVAHPFDVFTVIFMK